MTKEPISLEEELSKHGYRCTSPRRETMKILLGNHLPMTTAEIHRQISKKGINLVSVYRTIQLFCSLGIAASVDQVAEGQRFELSDDYRSHHHHLVCQSCGKTEDYEECALDRFIQKIFDRTKFRVMRHELRFLGACSSCA